MLLGNGVQRRLFRRDDGASEPGGDVELDAHRREQLNEAPPQILCDACGHRLTDAEARAKVDGAHRHVKVNPHGHVYHIACFRPVPGVVGMGNPSGEFSWFAGYRWQIALCGGCQVHLGWAFVGDTDFTALIEGRFIEEPAE